MNKSLYAITEEQAKLIEEIEALDGELTPEMEQKLALSKSELNHKSIAYLEIISRNDMMNSMIDDEIKRLQALKKRNSNLIDRLKDNLLAAVNTFGVYQVGTQKFGTRKSTGLIIEVDDKDLPKKYTNEVITIKADKAKIKKALQNGDIIDGCKLDERLNLKIN